MSYKKIALLLLLLTFLSGSFNIGRIIPNISIEARYLFLIAFVFIIIIEFGLNNSKLEIKKNSYINILIFFTLSYLFLLLISFFYTADQSNAIGKVELSIFLILLILSVLLTVNIMEDYEFFNFISIFFILIGILYAIPIILDVISGASRGTNDLSGPNVTTRILFFATCSSVYILLKNKKSIYFILSILFLFSIILVGSRGGFIGAVITLILLFTVKKIIVDWKTKRVFFNFNYKFILFIFLGIITLYLMFEPIKKVFMNRFVGTTFQNGTVYSSGRDVIYSNAIAMIKEKPIFGYGIDSFKVITGHVYPHNLLLEMMVEVGILGAIIFFVYILFALIIIFKLRNSPYFIFSGIPLYMVIVQMFSGEFYDFRFYFLWIIPLLFFLKKSEKSTIEIEKQN